MSDINKNSIIVIAEDDEDDYLLTMEALKEAGITEHQVKWVKDGEELMDFLNENIDSKSSSDCPSPGMILLDLNMPKKDGREALSEIKSNPNLRRIPVIVLTTSKAEGDIFHSYDLGVNSFIQKPVRFKQFVDVVKTLSKYWFETVKLPK